MAKLIDIDNLARFKANLDALFAAGGSLPDWLNMDTLFHDVMIFYRPKGSGSRVVFLPVSNWQIYKNLGEEAVGVVLLYGDRYLVIAPNYVQRPFYFEGATISSYGTRTVANKYALSDYEGEDNQSKLLLNEGMDDEGYAVGYCNAYQRLNSEGYGLAAGNWRLPSCGELLHIFENIDKIRYAMSLIDGADSFQFTNALWTNTVYNNTAIWTVDKSMLFLNYQQQLIITTLPVATIS